MSDEVLVWLSVQSEKLLSNASCAPSLKQFVLLL